jgi:hypothetical protein
MHYKLQAVLGTRRVSAMDELNVQQRDRVEWPAGELGVAT